MIVSEGEWTKSAKPFMLGVLVTLNTKTITARAKVTELNDDDGTPIELVGVDSILFGVVVKQIVVDSTGRHYLSAESYAESVFKRSDSLLDIVVLDDRRVLVGKLIGNTEETPVKQAYFGHSDQEGLKGVRFDRLLFPALCWEITSDIMRATNLSDEEVEDMGVYLWVQGWV